MDKKIIELKKEYQLYAQKKGFKLNSNTLLVDGLLKKMIENEEKYGYRYCPCRPINGNHEDDQKKVCPCFFSDSEIIKNGRCHCGLFENNEKN